PPPFPPFFSPSPAPPDLPSFPTRRSSDLDLGAILREAVLHRFQRHRLAVISVLIPADTRVVIHADDVEGAIRERFGRGYPDPADVFHWLVLVVIAGDGVESRGCRPGCRLQ